MLLQLQNGCEDQRTLDLYNKFIYSPHCVSGTMYPVYDDDGVVENEFTEITFTHYSDIITVVFKVNTGVGEVFLHGIDTIGREEDGSGSEEVAERVEEVITEEEFRESLMYCGLITEDNLVELLKSLPHIRNFMEVEVGEGSLH